MHQACRDLRQSLFPLLLSTGRHPASTPRSKRLASGRDSTLLLYMTGHGGDEFLKFHDQEELLAADLAAALLQMHLAGRWAGGWCVLVQGGTGMGMGGGGSAFRMQVR